MLYTLYVLYVIVTVLSMVARVLRGLSEITFIISIRNRPIKKAVALQLAALWSVVSGLNIRLRT